jgi:intein-encoded DNA endonuclease-like protein
MTVTGKHRELLIELLIYYLNKDNHDVYFAKFINEENPTGRYWIDAYIDDYKDLEYYIINNSPNKMLGIK